MKLFNLFYILALVPFKGNTLNSLKRDPEQGKTDCDYISTLLEQLPNYENSRNCCEYDGIKCSDGNRITKM